MSHDVSGFSAADYDQFQAALQGNANMMSENGSETLRLVSQLTGEGLIGDSADASNQLAAGFNGTMNATNDVLQHLNQAGIRYGESMGINDVTRAAEIHP